MKPRCKKPTISNLFDERIKIGDERKKNLIFEAISRR